MTIIDQRRVDKKTVTSKPVGREKVVSPYWDGWKMLRMVYESRI
jgi:hypothetical protein